MFGKKKVETCPNCLKEWSEKDLSTQQKLARKISFNEKFPLHAELPPNDQEKWCNPCLRDYMNLDRIDVIKTAMTGIVCYKKTEDHEPT